MVGKERMSPLARKRRKSSGVGVGPNNRARGKMAWLLRAMDRNASRALKVHGKVSKEKK
jgi:hypothetical protein